MGILTALTERRESSAERKTVALTRYERVRDVSPSPSTTSESGAPDIDSGIRHDRPIVSRRNTCIRICLYLTAASTFVIAILLILLTSLVHTLVNRLSPHRQPTGVDRIIENWSLPNYDPFDPWPTQFTAGINPVNCHSHNDYSRLVPLYSALAAGCISVEADIWLPPDGPELLIGHTARSLTPDKTLRSLYLDPLLKILEFQNQHPNNEPAGVFESSPTTSLVLLVDFKTEDDELWTRLHSQLDPLRAKGWLTRWDTGTNSRIAGPITVVATGSAPFARVVQSRTHDIFFDAPLTALAGNTTFTTQNSYYASTSMGEAVGSVWTHLRPSQLEIVRGQIGAARERGLVSRYWGTPGWPMAWRNRVWEDLVESGVGVLNVDSLETAALWDWRVCEVAGLRLCG
ncbi:Altered inheritance of mitochondria protein 6 [Onygenales sp. PD_12]|nr:Altered inheritance of mitochondria protein 6 [Onygenales sp. PD_12]KAK2801327.1 Altered inheritance of mitochondria protein 6 [Onygenales sp. PD_10]